MPKFNVHFTIKATGAPLDTPHSANPVEAADMADALTKLAAYLPVSVERNQLGARFVAVRVEEIEGPAEAEEA